MTRSTKYFWITALSVSVLIMTLFAYHPTSLPRRNQRVVESLLINARPNIEGCCIANVTLDDNVVLLPDKPIETHGYKIVLHATGMQYELIAQPQEYGRSGFLSFYMNEQS